MALKINWNQPRWYVSPENPEQAIRQDASFPNAYVAVTEYDGRKNRLSFVATVYADESKEEIIARTSYTIPHDTEDGSANAVRQGYLHLKSLPEFAGATDC